MWRLLGTGGQSGSCRGVRARYQGQPPPLPVTAGGGGLRGCSRFGGHAHGGSGDVDARLVGLLGCGGPGPRPIAATAAARWADLLRRRWWRWCGWWRWRYSARWRGRAGGWFDAGHAGAARCDAGRVLLVCGGAPDRQDDDGDPGRGCGDDEGDRGRAGAIPRRAVLEDRAPRADRGAVDGADGGVSWRGRLGGIPQRVLGVLVPPIRVEPTGPR